MPKVEVTKMDAARLLARLRSGWDTQLSSERQKLYIEKFMRCDRRALEGAVEQALDECGTFPSWGELRFLVGEKQRFIHDPDPQVVFPPEPSPEEAKVIMENVHKKLAEMRAERERREAERRNGWVN